MRVRLPRLGVELRGHCSRQTRSAGLLVRARGRAWSLHLHRRTAERRALSWVGVGPARETRPGMPHAELPDRLDPAGRIVGAAVHLGPWLLVVVWNRPPVTARRPNASVQRIVTRG